MSSCRLPKFMAPPDTCLDKEVNSFHKHLLFCQGSNIVYERWEIVSDLRVSTKDSQYHFLRLLNSLDQRNRFNFTETARKLAFRHSILLFIPNFLEIQRMCIVPCNSVSKLKLYLSWGVYCACMQKEDAPDGHLWEGDTGVALESPLRPHHGRSSYGCAAFPLWFACCPSCPRRCNWIHSRDRQCHLLRRRR